LTLPGVNDPPEVPFDPLLVPLAPVTVEPLLLGEALGLGAGKEPLGDETPEFDPFDPDGGEGTTAQGHGTWIMGGAQRSVTGWVVEEPLQLIGTLVLPSFRSKSSLDVFLTSTSFVGALNKRPVPSKRRLQYISYPEAWDAVKFLVAVFFFMPRPTPKPMAMATTARPAPPILSARLLTIVCGGLVRSLISLWGMVSQ